MVSIIIVNYRGGKFVELLLKSLERTIGSSVDYEVIIVQNLRTGYRTNSLMSYFKLIAKHYARILLRGLDVSEYDFDQPSGIKVVETKTGMHPVFWTRKSGVRGKAVSQSHAAGLSKGYSQISPVSEFVLLLDQDTVFLKKGWLKGFLGHFAREPDVVLVGTFREERIYQRPFLRPYCLMFRRAFYAQFDNLFLPTPHGDTCSRLTYLCEDHGKRYFLFKNSLNHPDVKRDPGWGDVALDGDGDVFFAHFGHSANCSARVWINQMERRVRSL